MNRPEDTRPLADEVQADPLTGDTQEARAARLRIVLELADAGLEMMRQNLRRAHPLESDAEIDERLLKWLRHRPGAEYGDAWGQPVLDRSHEA